MRRVGDRQALRNSLAGLLVFGVGLGLYLWGEFSEAGTIALMVVGGVLFQGDRVLELVRVWRRGTHEDQTRERRLSGAAEGVEPTP